MKAYLHNKLIRKLFRDAKMKAWAKMKKDGKVQALIEEDRRLKIQNKKSLRKTSELQNVLSIPK